MTGYAVSEITIHYQYFLLKMKGGITLLMHNLPTIEFKFSNILSFHLGSI